MNITTKQVESWWREYAATHETTLGAIEYIAQRAADHALEEAAKACDGQIERWTDDRARYCASECSAAIRAMKGTK